MTDLEASYRSLLDNAEQQRNVQRNATLTGAVEDNPDEYATKRRVAGYLGYPVGAVTANDASWQDAKREADVKSIDQNIVASPTLQRRYTSEDFARLAHDDSKALAKVQDWVGAAARYVMGADRDTGLPQDIQAGVLRMNTGAAGVWRAGIETIAPLLDPLAGTILPENPLRRVAAGFAKQGATTEAHAKTLDPAADASLVRKGVSSGVQSLTQNVLMLPAALATPAAALTGLAGVSGGQSYQQISEQKPGASQVEKLTFATSQGLIEYATEKLPLGQLVKDLSAAAPLYKTIARQLAAEIPGEQVATILQDMNEWAALPVNANRSFKDYLAERPSAAAQTLIATVVGVGGNVMVARAIDEAAQQYLGQGFEAKQADMAADTVTQLFKAAGSSALRERDAGTLASVIQEMADTTEGAPTEVYIDARTLAGEGGLLNQEQVAELLPSLTPAALAQAIATGGDIAIPIGELVAYASGTPLEQRITEHVRLTLDSVSQFEAREAAKQAADLLRQDAAHLMTNAVDRTELEQSAEKVKAEVKTQLDAANRFTAEVHDAYATLARDFYTVMSQRLGMSPEQMYAAYPLRVQAAGVGPIEQAAYHGTPHRGIEQFSTQHIGTGEGAQVYGWGMYFAGNAEVAEYYRKSLSPTGPAQIEKALNLNMDVADALTAAARVQMGELKSNTTPERLLFYRSAESRKMTLEQRVALIEKAVTELKKASGQLYHVDVPDSSNLLDYDARMKDQPASVRAALEKLGVDGSYYSVVDSSGVPFGGQSTFKTREEAQRLIRTQNLNAKIVERPSTMTGKEVYELLSDTLGGDEAASRALFGAGVPGLRYLDEHSRSPKAESKSHNYVIFDDSAVKKLGEFYQGPRGTFDPNTLTISLLEQADLSTFLHETGHFFLEVMADVAAQPGAPEQVTKDMATLLDWFGVKDLATWNEMTLDQQRKHHEKFAESFEQYLFEGKAPSAELNGLFARFRSWLTNVYRSLSAFMESHDTQLSAEVRGVFNRMLASDEAIESAEAARAYLPAFDSAEAAGMTPEQWAAYQAVGQKATDAAVTELTKRSLRDMRWTRNAHARALKDAEKDVNEKRRNVQIEVRAAVLNEPVYAALNAMQAKGGPKIGREALAELVKGKDLDTKPLDRVVRVAGEHPDVLAEVYGFTSGDEMVRALIAAPPIDEVVEGKTDQTMLERFGDLATPHGIKRAADEAVHNEARARFMATGLRALTDAAKLTEKPSPVNVILRAAREFATGLVARKKVRELKPGDHLRAETRAGKALNKAQAAGDTQAAIVAQRDQLLNHYAAKYTEDARDEVERTVAYLKRVQASKTLAPEYLDQVQTLLDRFDLLDTPLKVVDKRKTLLEWVESQRAIGADPEIPPELLDEARRKSYKDMTVEEFRGLRDTVKQIEHLGRLKNKLLTAKDQREFDAVRDSIAASITDNAGERQADTRSPTSNWGRALQAMRNFGAAHIKAATLARILDGGKDGGPMWDAFVRSANERGDQEVTMRAKATRDLADILGPWLKRGNTGGKGQYFQHLNRSFNREALLAIALNTGNAGNLQRLLGGENWTEEQLKPLLSALTARDWEVVQKVWDYFESFRPLIGEKQKRVYGVEPEWIEPTPRRVELADGTTVDVRGGYYPIKYDPAASVRAEEHADADAARRQLQGSYNAATTRRSFTKTRAEEVNGRPLLYTLQGIYSGVNDVIHDLAWHEWLIDANRLLKSQAIDGAIREHYGPEVVRQFKTWRDTIAEGDGGSHEAIDQMLGRLRQGVSVAGLGFNVMSAAIQPLGITQSIVRVGATWIGKGVWQYIANPAAARRGVIEKSEFMENRARTFNRELNELQNRVQGKVNTHRYAYMLMMAAQSTVDTPTWLGAYEKAIADGNDESRAVALADQAVIDSQGSGRVQDLSAIERGGPAAKLFTVFYGFMNTALNLGVASKMTPTGKAKFAADMVMLYVLPAVLATALKNALTPGDSGDAEDWKTLARKLIAEEISYLLGLMIGAREVAEAGKTVAGVSDQPRDYAGPAGVRVIADAHKAAQQAAQGEFDDAWRKAMVNFTGSLFGLPAAQINRSITGAKALKEGKTKNPAALFLGYQEPR